MTDVAQVIVCKHCPQMEAAGLSHTKSCRCTHHHNDHVYGSGCAVKGCVCDKYDQGSYATRAPKEPKDIQVPTESDVNVQKWIAGVADISGLATPNKSLEELLAAQQRLDTLRAKKVAKEAETVQ